MDVVIVQQVNIKMLQVNQVVKHVEKEHIQLEKQQLVQNVQLENTIQIQVQNHHQLV